SARTEVTDLEHGIYEFELTVTDAAGLFSKDSVTITLLVGTNHDPIANAGADQTIIVPADIASMNGSASTDADSNIASYLWTKISGPSQFNITSPTLLQTQVTGLVVGNYQFELSITDSAGARSKDTITIFVINSHWLKKQDPPFESEGE